MIRRGVARLGAMQPERFQRLLYLALVCLAAVAQPVSSTKLYEFNITERRITRLCSTKSIILVNGEFPGPAIHVTEGDSVVVKVNNLVNHNITLHWHGLFQRRTGWFDGPAYVTQCPIQPHKSFNYKLNFTGQRGTFWWHAHITFLRATVHGSMIVHPKYRFPFLESGEETPEEHTVILGEWWKSDILDVIGQAMATGLGTNLSDAYTINGLPGPFYGNCSVSDTHFWTVLPGKKYLLRLISAAMNSELFFGIANHTMTVVEADAQYTKPFTTDFIVMAPGQTLTVLISTDQEPGAYYMAAHAFASTPEGFPLGNTTTAAILNYQSKEEYSTEYPENSNSNFRPVLPSLPDFHDWSSASEFESRIRSRKRVRTESPIPTNVDELFFIAVGLNIASCPPGANPNTSCLIPVPGGGRFQGSMNNISYREPKQAFLKQHYDETHFGKKPVGYTKDFPRFPADVFNFTASPATLLNLNADRGARAIVVEYGSNVEVVIQGTSLIAPENHPVHLHGFDFYVLATGLGNFNYTRDSRGFNLVDPPLRNTVSVPAAGWAVLRFKADNPGTWMIHCHLDGHSLTGLATVIIVKDGTGQLESLESPPEDLPPC